jgi:hypothetical protein
MSTPVTTPKTLDHTYVQTRWQELQRIVTTIVEISSVLDKNGVDVYFLNRSPVKGISNTRQIVDAFNYEPHGFTPICNTLRKVIHEYSDALTEKKLLIILVTDGAPTDDRGKTDAEINKMYNLLKKERSDRIYTTIIACTDDTETMNYLSNWDEKLRNLDVVDDYESEKIKIQRCRGKNVSFSYGDYVVKSLIGSIDPEIDNLNEKQSCRIPCAIL